MLRNVDDHGSNPRKSAFAACDPRHPCSENNFVKRRDVGV